MSHFAKIGLDNKVIDIVVVDTRDTMNAAGEEVEEIGIQFLKNLTGHETWKKTSYNTFEGVHAHGKTPYRKNYAIIGGTYDSARDAFIRPKPLDCASWVLNEDKCVWEPPVPCPGVRGDYMWDEATVSWITYDEYLIKNNLK